MGARLRSWWQKIKRPLLAIGIIAVSVLLVALIVVEVRFYGTGFAGKTLWDWLQLISALAIPVVVGFGAVWFTIRQGKVADAENKDNQCETALQAYIDKISELLLEKNLRDSAEEVEVRKIARVRTLTVLRGLDLVRKGSVLQFLYEAGLIIGDRDKVVILLQGADLNGARLTRIFLNGVNLSRVDLNEAMLYRAILTNAILELADLRGANMREADLIRCDLSRADLSEADLSGAILIGANLTGANLRGAIGTTPEQLKQAKSLQGATMPDGSIHP